MGKTGKWFKSFLTGKKDKDKEKENCLNNHNASTSATENHNPTTPIATRPTTPREKRRWSFRRSSATAAATAPKDLHPKEPAVIPQPMPQTALESKNEQKNTDVTVEATTDKATETVAVVQLAEDANVTAYAIEEAAAINIQSVFRSYLARKALRALKGLVKLQALVRGHLVRRQATATLRCMQALVTVQAKVRAQRLRMAEETKFGNHRHSSYRKSTQDYSHRDAYQDLEEDIKIVEMDLGESKGSTKSRNSYSNYPHTEKSEHRFSTHYVSNQAYSKEDNCQVSPTPSALTDMSPRACSGHYEEYSFNTAQSSPQCYSAVSKPDSSRIPFSFPRQEDYADSLSYDYPLFPNYMANTESSRAKARSQSAPKSRPDSFDRQPSRRRPSVEGRNIPRAIRMQRSSSHVGAAAQNYQYPWSVRLDKSTVSLRDSECGSTSTLLSNITYCRSLAGYDPRGIRY